MRKAIYEMPVIIPSHNEKSFLTGSTPTKNFKIYHSEYEAKLQKKE